MVQSKHYHQIHLPEMQAVNRITNLPIVETGWTYAEHLYTRIKASNNLLHWTLDQAETSLYTVIDTASPAVFLFAGPLTTIDQLLCSGLDLVEEKVPSINLPPQMIYSNTKQYVTDVGTKIVRPVLKRADSVKQIGNDILASKYTTYAADKLDGALNVADMYVEKYLPADASDRENESLDVVDFSGPTGKALQTSQHVARFSKKVQRRLTRRTLLEAKALKEQSVEAIHVLVYVLELVATDPKLAFQKGKELWASLSRDEPENQARPENLEQLIVLLTREIARHVVHLINFTALGISKAPHRANQVVHALTVHCSQLLDLLFKTLHLDGVQQLLWTMVQNRAHTLTLLIKRVNVGSAELLERMASILISIDKCPDHSEDEEKSVALDRNTTNANTLIATIAEMVPARANTEKKKPSVNNSSVNSTHNAKASPAATDSLKPPPVANKVQLKATHRNNLNEPNALITNGESPAPSS